MNNLLNNSELIETFLKEYNLVYRVNLSDASFSLLKMDKGIVGQGLEFADFTEARKFFLDKVAYKSDKKMLTKEMEFDQIRKRLKDGQTYSVEYRAVIDGVAIWHEMFISSLGKDEVIIGFAIRDSEVLNRHISKTLMDNYDAIYVVNFNTDQIKVLKASGIMNDKPKVMAYSEMLDSFSSSLSGDAKEHYIKAKDIEYEKKVLKKEGKIEFFYQSPNYGKELVWLKSETCALTWDNGEPETAVVGISRVDSLQREKIKLNEQLADALRTVTDEKNRFAVAADLINSANWSFTLNEKDEVVDAEFYGEPIKILGIDLEISPHAWEQILHPEDKEKALAAFNATIKDHTGRTPYDIMYRMMDKNGKYNWFRSAGKIIIHEDGHREFFGIHININERIEEQNKQLRETENSRKLIESVASIYRFAFSIDMSNGDFSTIRFDEEVKRRLKVDKITNYEDAINPLFNMLHPMDVEMMKHELDFDTIRKKLANSVSYNIEYRVISDDSTDWHEMNVTKISGDRIAMGFGERDIAITKHHLEELRFAEYFALYEVDIDREKAKIIIDSPYYGIDRSGLSVPYVSSLKTFASTLDSDARAFFLQLSNFENVKEFFAKEGKHTFTYQSTNVEGKWVDCTFYVTHRHEDGTPAMFTMGFSYIDSHGAARQDLQNQILMQKNKLEEQQAQLQDALDTANREAQRNDLLIEAMSAGKWSYEISPEDDVVAAYYSNDLYSATGTKRATGKPMSWIDYVYPEDKGRVMNEFMATIFDHTGRTPYDTTFRMVSKTGEIQWTRSTGRVIRYADGSGEFFGVTMDLTDQIATQEKLARRTAISDYFLKSYVYAYYIDIIREEVLVLHSEKGAAMSLVGKTIPLKDALDSFLSHVEEEDKKEIIKYINTNFIKNQIKASKEFSFTYKDISPIAPGIFRCTIIPGDDENHAAIGFKDITEEIQKQQEQMQALDLANQQRHIKAFGDMVNAALWSIDIDDSGEIINIQWSDEFRHMFGFEDVEDFPNTIEAWSERLHPDDKERTVKNLFKSFESKETEDFVYDTEYRMLRKNNEYCWYHALGRMEYNDDGTRRVYGIIFDISADKRLEEQLALTDGLSRDYHTVWLLDGFGEHRMHLYRSTGVKTLKPAVQLGLNAPFYDSGIIKYVHDYVHEEDQERVLEQAKFETIERETPEVGTYVVTYRRYNLERTSYDYHQMCYAKAVAEDGTVNYIFAYRDADKMMREQIAQQNLLQEALADAQLANKAKTEFLFNMSHDIRTPMNAILGFTNMATKHLDDKEKVLDCLEKIKQSGGLLLSLINGVLDVSRIEHEGSEIEEKEGDVLLSFASIETTLRQEAQRKDITLDFEFGKVTDRYVMADFLKCLRIFTNLISNAIKYTGEGGHIKVRCEQAAAKKNGYAMYRYTFEDNGIGMSEEFQKEMFDPFSREYNSTTSGIQGTGLGLSVCRTFVDFLGGSIDCESKLGKGTKFTVILPFRVQKGKHFTDPLTGEALDAIPNVDGILKKMDFSGKKVLLVEDNEMNREIAVEILEDEGIYVEEAENGKRAVEILKEKGAKYYDFILMDIQMPIMNGYEATKKIREMYPKAHVPIIALSANAFEEDRSASIEAGMDDHVAKPIVINELFKVMAKF